MAADAETLMRSRYSAYALNQRDYLLRSWHSSTRPAELAVDTATKWLALDVRWHRLIDEAHAEVEFVARYRVSGRGHRMHEVSRFVCEAGSWFYVDGEVS